MAELDPFTTQYAAELDGILATYVEDYRANLDTIFDEADAALVALGKRISPNHRFKPLREKVDREQSRTQAALAQFRVDSDEASELGARYRIMPGDIGPIPEDLEVGKTYRLRGFASEEHVGTSLSGAYAFRFDDGAYSFLQGADYRMTYFDGESFRYDGNFVSQCDICEDHTPYDSFTKLRPNGEVEMDRDYIPKQFAALSGMVTIIGEGMQTAEAA